FPPGPFPCGLLRHCLPRRLRARHSPRREGSCPDAGLPDSRQGAGAGQSETRRSNGMTMRRTQLVIVAVVGLLAAAAAAVALTVHGGGAHGSTLVAESLGRPQPAASLIRPAVGAKLEVAKGGLTLTSGKSSLSLAFGKSSAASWRRFEHGVSRPTSFGNE